MSVNKLRTVLEFICYFIIILVAGIFTSYKLSVKGFYSKINAKNGYFVCFFVIELLNTVLLGFSEMDVSLVYLLLFRMVLVLISLCTSFEILKNEKCNITKLISLEPEEK